MEQGHSQERVVQLGQSAMWPNQGEWSAPFQLYGCHVQPSDGSRNSQPTSGWPLPWLPPPPPPPPPNYQWQSSAVQQQTHNYDHYQDSNYGNGYGHQQAEQVDTYTDVSFGRRKNSHQNDKEWCFGNGSVKEEPYEYKTQREMDQDYINKFLVERGAFKNTTESKPSKRSLKVCSSVWLFISHCFSD